MAVQGDPHIGIGTPVPGGPAPTTIPDPAPRSCVSLARYAQIIGYNECALFGVSEPSVDTTCFKIMSQFDRENIERYLSEAQEEIERVTRYPLCPTWYEDELHPHTYPVRTRWAKVLESGVRATTMIEEDSVVDHSADPSSIGPIATTLTDTSEIRVYYPNSEREIEPQTVQITGGQLTIWIPRCRMVDPDNWDNPVAGWDYNDTTILLNVVDVVREYNDISTQAELVWPTGKCCPVCTETASDACLPIGNGRIGEVRPLPATYSGGAWTRSASVCCTRAPYVRVNYRAGLNPITLQAEDSVIRLAHSKMPRQPCAGCDYTQGIWARDREVTDPVSIEQVRNPFGRSDGALTAWRFANAMRFVRGYTL